MCASKAIVIFSGALLVMLSSISPAAAPFTPTTHRVTGIPENDVLNVRVGPSAQSEDVGDLQAAAGPLEILEVDATGNWGRLSWKDGDGWVSMHYLEPITLPTLGDSALPIALKCSGTEPFWAISLNDANTLQLSLSSQPDTNASIKSVTTSVNYIDYPVAITANAENTGITAIIKPVLCSDGMSDRNYGWEADVLVTNEDATTLLSGCCGL